MLLVAKGAEADPHKLALSNMLVETALEEAKVCCTGRRVVTAGDLHAKPFSGCCRLTCTAFYKFHGGAPAEGKLDYQRGLWPANLVLTSSGCARPPNAHSSTRRW